MLILARGAIDDHKKRPRRASLLLFLRSFFSWFCSLFVPFDKLVKSLFDSHAVLDILADLWGLEIFKSFFRLLVDFFKLVNLSVD